MTDAAINSVLATSRLRVDLDAMSGNWRRLTALSLGASTGAAVKADAYGLGAEKASAALHAIGCKHFFVATPAEGIAVRPMVGDAEVFVLAGLSRQAAPYYFEADLTPVLNDPGEIELWSDWCKQSGMRRPCALHVDTGMNRLGLTMAELANFADDPACANSVTPALLMSHLACGDEPFDPMNAAQLAKTHEAARLVQDVRVSLANSAGVFLGPDYHFDITRPGIALYGGEAVNGVPNPMTPVASFEGRILQVRKAARGETVGYGATTRLTRDSRIAIAGAGYADGVMRGASGSGVVMRERGEGAKGWLGGRPVPLLGRISMDLAAFDVTDVPDAVLEHAQWIEFFGKHTMLDDFARAAGTVGYEVLTRISRRAERVYLGG